MTKEQITLRTLPLIRIGLVKLAEKEGFKNLNEYLVFILESHLYKKNQEEKITESVEKRIDDLEEKQNKVISELVIESKYNKALLARIAKTLELDKEV
ncbi:hypothetical protein N7577_07450 [Enterobacter roggenkampii]|uniref:hypothetical protein n=1 Tax=Enterobacter roggenkampii TaxID=1812935 RepID=UPI00244CD60C|nr:hypothetical protein [Enterobacter roggenkampii]MDG9878073.1 hypothetical protein [Enterobacter roggenkampii]